MKRKYCKNCHEEIIKIRKNQKFCKDLCRKYWLYYNDDNFRERNKNYSIKWHKDNPKRVYEMNKRYIENNREEFNKSMLKVYQRNREKYNSRHNVRGILNGKYHFKKEYNLKRKCHKCNSNRNLHLRYEIYPTTINEIISALDNHKIYYLCIKCRKSK